MQHLATRKSLKIQGWLGIYYQWCACHFQLIIACNDIFMPYLSIENCVILAYITMHHSQSQLAGSLWSILYHSVLTITKFGTVRVSLVVKVSDSPKDSVHFKTSTWQSDFVQSQLKTARFFRPCVKLVHYDTGYSMNQFLDDT